MDYKTYRLYQDGVEVMIPSDMEPAAFGASSQNMWLSKDKKTIISVTRGGADLTEGNLDSRLNEYYKGFCKDTSRFDCRAVSIRTINMRTYGEIQYLSQVSGYSFYNVFLLGCYRGRELIVTVQCLEGSREANERSLGIISDSIRILKKEEDEGK